MWKHFTFLRERGHPVPGRVPARGQPEFAGGAQRARCSPWTRLLQPWAEPGHGLHSFPAQQLLAVLPRHRAAPAADFIYLCSVHRCRLPTASPVHPSPAWPGQPCQERPGLQGTACSPWRQPLKCLLFLPGSKGKKNICLHLTTWCTAVFAFLSYSSCFVQFFWRQFINIGTHVATFSTSHPKSLLPTCCCGASASIQSVHPVSQASHSLSSLCCQCRDPEPHSGASWQALSTAQPSPAQAPGSPKQGRCLTQHQALGVSLDNLYGNSIQ